MGLMESISQINYLAVLVSTLIAMGLGALWYSPVLFGNAWMKELGFKAEDIKPEEAKRGIIVSAVTTLIELWVLALLIVLTGIPGILMGIVIGGLVSVGCIAMVVLSSSMYEQRTLKVWLINVGYRIVYFIIAGAIFGVWR